MLTHYNQYQSCHCGMPVKIQIGLLASLNLYLLRTHFEITRVTSPIAACGPHLIQLFKRFVSDFNISITPCFISFISHPSTIFVCCLDLFPLTSIIGMNIRIRLYVDRMRWIIGVVDYRLRWIIGVVAYRVRWMVLTIVVSFRLAWIWVIFITWIVMGTSLYIFVIISFFSQIFLVRSDAIFPLRITCTVQNIKRCV